MPPRVPRQDGDDATLHAAINSMALHDDRHDLTLDEPFRVAN